MWTRTLRLRHLRLILLCLKEGPGRRPGTQKRTGGRPGWTTALTDRYSADKEMKVLVVMET
jgi:hypothetical protein